MIYTIKNTSFPSNTYIVACPSNNGCIIIDPGIDYLLAEKIIEKDKLVPVAILCTHGHFDHIANVSFFKEKYDVPFYIHSNDKKTIKSANFFLKFLKINFTINTPMPDVLWHGKGTILALPNFDLEIKNMPGHSPGSCIIKWGNNLFTGDIFYKKGLGFNSFPDENKKILKTSIKEIFGLYDHGIMIYPGHGDAELLGTIIKNNKELAYFLTESNIDD